MARKLFSLPGAVAHYALGSALMMGMLVVHGHRVQRLS